MTPVKVFISFYLNKYKRLILDYKSSDEVAITLKQVGNLNKKTDSNPNICKSNILIMLIYLTFNYTLAKTKLKHTRRDLLTELFSFSPMNRQGKTI